MLPRMCMGVCLLVGSVCSTATGGAPPARHDLPRFTARPIGGLDFGDLRITAVNDRGSAAGMTVSRVGDGFRYSAFFRDRRGNLQEIASDDLLTVVDMNDRDWVVGSTTGGAFAWNERDGMIPLGSLGGRASYADGINDHNQVVGFTDTVGGERRAFLWDRAGGMRTLSVPAGSGTSTAHDISNKGTIAGHTYLRGGGMQHANIWTRDGRFVDLGELPGGHEEAAAFAVNEKDHVVGYSITEEDHRAFFWSEETGMINLGALPGTSEGSVAYDINDHDWVVGTSRSPGTITTGKPFLWTPDWGLLDLNNLLAPDSDDWTLYEAKWVNDHGDILAIGRLGEAYQVVLLNAHNPEPGALLLLGAAGAPLLLRRRRAVP